MFEKERFPRFHIGESLLPGAIPLFDELGVLPELESGRFLRKYAAEFVSEDGSTRKRYPFAGGFLPGSPYAFEVDRAEFDQVLLEHAERRGVSVEQGCQVLSFSADLERGIEVVVRAENGEERRETAEMLVDASGQSALLPSRLGLREMEPSLRNVAVFSHFEGASRKTGDEEGDISVVFAPDGWWWVIPLRGDRTSVGLVGRAKTLGAKPDAEFLASRIEACPYVRERLAAAKRVAPVRTVSDWSYKSRALAGDRWLLVGDAGAFIDPVFSTGVQIGMTAAFDAAECIDRALAERRFGRSAFVPYERRVQNLVSTYTAFVKGFYTREFAELLMRPSEKFSLRAAITSLLAGHGMKTLGLAWRVELFCLLARVNHRMPFVPRLLDRRTSRSQATT